jgi:hypothetical protein
MFAALPATRTIAAMLAPLRHSRLPLHARLDMLAADLRAYRSGDDCDFAALARRVDLIRAQVLEQAGNRAE